MGKFLRENWVWVAAPIVVVAVLIALFYWLSDDPGASPFIYQSF